MKVVPFTIPVPADTTIHTQHEQLPYFYEHLHRHREMQLTWVVKGKGSLLAGQYLQPFTAGDVYLLGPQLPHVFKSDPAYFAKRSKLSVEAYSIFFDPGGPLQQVLQLPEMQQVLRWLQHYQHGCKVNEQQASKCRQLIAQVVLAEGAERLALFILLMKQLCGSRRHKALSAEPRLLREAEGQRMNRIIQFSTRHYQRHITIEEAATQVHMTPQAFCRYFKKHTRKTYINFLSELRIHEACKQLLENGMGNMASIAWDSGFSSVPDFNRVFKKVMTCTPGEYVRRANA
jgi:AraC-like DNA-binding protein